MWTRTAQLNTVYHSDMNQQNDVGLEDKTERKVFWSAFCMGQPGRPRVEPCLCQEGWGVSDGGAVSRALGQVRMEGGELC